jgi:hypothetical protein
MIPIPLFVPGIHNTTPNKLHQLNNHIQQTKHNQQLQNITILIHLTQKPTLKLRVRSLRKASTDENYGHEAAPASYNLGLADTSWENSTQYAAATDSLRESITLRTPLAVSQVAQDIVVPELEAIQIEETVDEEDVATYQLQQNQLATQGVYVQGDTSIMPLQQPEATFEATTSTLLPFPSKPTDPNKLVGMVLTPQNDVVAQAIVEIKKENGTTVRAVKTNALGQFFISTPLPDGTYIIETEKESLQFATLHITLSGKIVEPIEIRSIV